MCRFPSTIALLTFALLTSIAEANQPAPMTRSQFVRLAVIDVSSSMSGERLRVARDELGRVAKQLTPSETHPFIVVPFDSSVRNVHTFTDLQALEEFLSELDAGGGTNIASGLARAIDELNRYPDTPNICVLLYTDGEDGMRQQIAAEEAKLDALFADRRTRGLDQTVVFCKRWQGAGAQLLKQLADHGNARIIDAAELDLVPITLTPHVTVEQAQWVNDKPSTLEVTLAAQVVAHGEDTNYTGGNLLLECHTANTEGDLRVSLNPSDPAPTPVTLRVDLPPKTALAGGQVELEFELAQPPPTQGPDSLTLPLLTLDHIRVPVDLPVTTVRSIISAQINQIDPGRWADPLALEPIFPMRITLDVTTADNETMWTCPVPFRLTPQTGTRLVDGQDTVVLRGPGQYELAFSITGIPAREVTPENLPEFDVAFRIHPETTPLNVRFEPAELNIDVLFAAPPPVVTDISARFVAVGQRRWVDLGRAVALFDAELEVSVDGPIWSGAKLALRCPPPVRDVKITPSQLHEGTQIVRLGLLAVLPPAPTQKELVFDILLPPQQGALRLRAIRPFSHSLSGPPPVQLALSDGHHVCSGFRTSHRDSTHPAKLAVTPVVLGLQSQTASNGIGGSIQTSGLLAENTATPLPLYASSDLQITFPPDAKRSFFRDTRMHGEISIVPSPETPALVGSTHAIQATLEAPFKRLLCQLAIAISSLLAFFLMVRMFLRLRTPPSA